MTTVPADGKAREASYPVETWAVVGPTLDGRSPAAQGGEAKSSPDSFVVEELTTALRSLETLHDACVQFTAEGQTASVPKMLCCYEDALVSLRHVLRLVSFDGREHLLREIQSVQERYRQPAFQNTAAGWLGTPGVEERWRRIVEQWSEIDAYLRPLSNEAALRQLVQYAAPQHRQDLIQPSPHFASLADARLGPYSPSNAFPGVINLNMANSGVDVRTQQKTSQDLQQELKLAQTIEIANSQEQRFAALLKDLNASAAELNTHIDQAQNAQQDIVDASATSKQIVTELKAQNAAAQQITNEMQRDRGLSRTLLTACAVLVLTVNFRKLTALLPLLKRVPGIQHHAEAIEKYRNGVGVDRDLSSRALPQARSAVLLSNLMRERQMYKLSYEALHDVAEIEQSGNLMHRLLFGILERSARDVPGLGRMLKKRMERLAPPSDMLEAHERWTDQRTTPYGPAQWTKSASC